MNEKFDFGTRLNKLEASGMPNPQGLGPVAETEVGDPLVPPTLATPINIPKAASSAAPKKPKPEPVAAHEPLPPEAPMQGYDEFSPENLRVLNTMDLGKLVRQELVGMPVRKPERDEWFKVHPDYQQQGGILEFKSQKKIYWVSKKMQSQVEHDPCFSFRLCVLAVNRQGAPFIWPVRPNGEADGAGPKWVQIPFAAMIQSKEKWTRLYWSQASNEHLIDSSELLDEPKFPDKPFPELLKLAFKDTMIDTVDHPAILELKGRAK